MASEEIQFVQKMFHPPALGGSFLARRVRSVLQSMACRSTAPILVNRSPIG